MSKSERGRKKAGEQEKKKRHTCDHDDATGQRYCSGV